MREKHLYSLLYVSRAERQGFALLGTVKTCGEGLLCKINLLSLLRAEGAQLPQRVFFQPCHDPQGQRASCCTPALGRDGVLEDTRVMDFPREMGSRWE